MTNFIYSQIWLAVFLAYIFGFWGLFTLSMGLYRAYLKKTLTPAQKVLGAPYVLATLIVDVLFNLVPATIIFLELPTTWTLTQRMVKAIKEKPSGDYRRVFSMWICKNLLDPLDPSGIHCTGDGYVNPADSIK